MTRNEKLILWLAGMEQIKGQEKFCAMVYELIEENKRLKEIVYKSKYVDNPEVYDFAKTYVDKFIDEWDGGAYE